MTRSLGRMFSLGLGAVLLMARGAESSTLVQSGRLLDAQDQPITATVPMRFRVFTQSTGGAAPWDSGVCGVPVRAGLYALVLGRDCGSSIPATVLETSDERWLEVEVGGVVLSPRQSVGAIPTARLAAVADRATSAALADRATDSDKLGGVPATSYLTGADAAANYATRAAPTVVGAGLSGNGSTAQPLAIAFGATATTAVRGDDVRLSDARIPSGSAGGDLSGVFPSPTVSRIQGVSVAAGTPVDGAILRYNASAGRWEPGAAPPTSDGTKLALTGGTLSGALRVATTGEALVVDGSIRMGTDTRTCAAALYGALRWSANALEVCSTEGWVSLMPGVLGTTSQRPGKSCADIKTQRPTATDGAYWVDPTPLTSGDAVQVWCDMSVDGGGWTTIANTLRPGLDNIVGASVPPADLAVRNPTSRNLAVWKWSGDAWTELMVECRTSASANPARWIFVRSAQSSAIQTLFNEFIVNANSIHQGVGTGGNTPCYPKSGGTLYCGHNNSGSETTWGDGFQIGTTSPNWGSLLFGATDAQAQYKCDQSTPYAYNSTSGSIGADAIYTFRIR